MGDTGTVQVYDGSKLIGTGTLVGGTVTIHITKNLKSGKHTLTVNTWFDERLRQRDHGQGDGPEEEAPPPLSHLTL